MDKSDIDSLIKEAFHHAQAGRHADAEAALSKILTGHPYHAEALHELGMLTYMCGRPDDALKLLKRSVESAPDVFRSRYNLGLMLMREGGAGGYVDAIPHFRRAVEISPQRLEALNALGNCYREIGELEESIRAYRRVLAVAPDDAMAHLNMAVSLQDQGKLSEAIAFYERALELKGGRHPLTHSNLVLCLNYSDEHTPQQVFQAHREFARRYESFISPPLPPRPVPSRRPQDQDRIRIGYLSPDFRGHSVAFFVLPVLNHHDRSRFEVTCYSDVATSEPMTEVLNKVPERWRDTAGLDDDRLALIVEHDRIDILVDLCGHTPHNRLPLLAARRIAPIQVTYLGYPNTTGLSTIDYRITDAIQDPPGMTEAFHSEQLVRLPRSFFTQLTISGLPEIAPLPALQGGRGGVTFAVFTNFVKVRPPIMKLWARILREVNGSRLLIQARSLRDRVTREMVTRVFADEKIPAERLDLREYVEFPQYIAMYKDVDIVLDTFPFNGHTTTCQALWMGVPVVTLAGQVSRSRMGASVLSTIDLNELVAQSEDEYVRIATKLAGDLPRLSAMRSGLRDRVAQSPILDCAGFTRELEAAYVEMIGKLPTTR